jgi:hypothetical protein
MKRCANSTSDDVVGDEVAQPGDIEIVGLFFADVLNRGDLVPPDVRVGQLLERGRGGRLGKLGYEARRRAAGADMPVVAAGPSGELADLGPGSIALCEQDVVPDLRRNGVGVRRAGGLGKPGKDPLLPLLLARNRDQLAETP